MKDINNNLKIYKYYYTSNCEFSKNNQCIREGGCLCSSVSTMYAYMKSVLPNGYEDYSFHDFDGFINEKRVLDTDRTREVRERIWEFCYGDTWNSIGNKSLLKKTELDKLSVIDKRFSRGESLVIYGNSLAINKNESNYSKISTGKTLIASIIMNQVIRHRLYRSNNASSYDWVLYPMLVSLLIDYNSNDGNSIDYIQTWNDTDWLVVDDIMPPDTNMSAKQHALVKNRLDNFFTHRAEKMLPSILVFQFDIDKFDIAQEYGYAISQIISSKNTYIIKV